MQRKYKSNQTRWDILAKETVTPTKVALTNLSIKVRTTQMKIFDRVIKPMAKDRILDVGVTSDEILKDSNLFEKLYLYPKNLTAATIEDAKEIKKMYPKLNCVVTVKPQRRLPFKDKSFDVVVSWATLEHTGDYRQQEFFLNELLRVGKKIFITTPYRGAIYEPHTGLFLLHWLPLSLFRHICKLFRKEYWATTEHLNPLWVSDIRKMGLSRKVKIRIFKTFDILPSHIIITS